MQSLKEQAFLLSEQLRKAGAPEITATVKLLEVLLAEVKDKLVSSSGDDMLHKQGAARQLRSLIDSLTIAPHNATPPRRTEL